MARARLIMVVVLFSLLTAFIQDSQNASMDDNSTYFISANKLARIKDALKSLMARRDRFSYLAPFEKASKKCVVVIGLPPDHFLLHLSLRTLTTAERIRAAKFFSDRGVAVNTSGPFPSHQLLLDNNIDLAADLVLSVFRDVYLLPVEFRLGLSEN